MGMGLLPFGFIAAGSSDWDYLYVDMVQWVKD